MGAPRILMIRTGALGDVVHALPVLIALRKGLPRARIGWVVEEPFAPLLARHPDLDELVIIGTQRWRRRPFAPRTWQDLARLVATLDRFSPEVVLDLMGNHKGGLLAALTFADRRIGLACRFRREPSSAVWLSEPIPGRGRHVVDRWLAFVEALGLDSRPVDFGGDKLLRAAQGGAQGPPHAAADRRILVHPGASWGNKCYPAERWGEVVRLLAAETGLRAWAVPGPGEEALATRVAESSQGNAEALPAPDLHSLAFLHRQAALVMGGDTGPIHLAHAIGTPVLCLMGPTDPARNGPYGKPRAALWRSLPCSFCHKRMNSAKACLLDVPPAEVAARAKELLGEN